MRQLLYLLSITGQLIGCVALAIPGYAQAIVPDGTLPTNVSSPDGRNFMITGGSQAGGNLFHSFGQFSVPSGGSAVFDNTTAGIQNIIGRVTGGSLSMIDGLISTTSPVNLFLINPSGIIFGPSASLSIGGSFIASTATSLKFSDGTEFRASNQTAPLLTMTVPIGLQYSSSAAPIQVQKSSLAVAYNQTLALIGGDVVINSGELLAPNGQIELSGANSGTVGLNFTGGQWQFAYPANLTRANVILTNGATIKTSGDGGGTIQLVSKQLTVQNSRVEANTLGAVSGGSLKVNASDSVTVSSDSGFDKGLFVENQGSGAVSGLAITTNRLFVQGEARLSTATHGSGRGGDLTINALDSTKLIGADTSDPTVFTGLVTDTFDGGVGGNLTVNTGKLTVRDGAQISAVANGAASAGQVTINAAQSVELIGASASDSIASGLFTAVAETGEAGRAGNISINTGRLIIQDGAQIFAGTGSRSDGGNIIVNATDLVDVNGVSPVFKFPGGIFSAANPSGVGQAGNITINTRQLTVQNGGSIAVETLGLGQSGKLFVNATDSVRLIGQGPMRNDPLNPDRQIPTFSSLSANVLNPGNAQDSGDIFINTGLLKIQGGARVSVDNEGTGRGGDISIQARTVSLDDLGNNSNNPGGLRAVTLSGEGGNIMLQLRGLLLMQNGNLIATDASGGSGNGGDINIQASILSAFNNSDITANAIQGRGGNIRVDAKAIIGTQFRPSLTPKSDITASSRFGASGVVEIRTPDVDPTRGLVALPTQPLDSAHLLAQGCGTNPGGEVSRFAITGRGGLPPSPEEVLGSDAVVQDLRTVPIQVKRDRFSGPISQSISIQPSSSLVEAQGLVKTSQGEIFLVAQASNVTLTSPWVAPLSCRGH